MTQRTKAERAHETAAAESDGRVHRVYAAASMA